MFTTDLSMVTFLITIPLSTIKLRSGYWQGQYGFCCIKHPKSKKLVLFAQYWSWQYTKNSFCLKMLIDKKKSIMMLPEKLLPTFLNAYQADALTSIFRKCFKSLW